MGIIQRGILGGFSKKVANVVGGSWKGIAYMRSLPLSVAQPNTAAQQNQKTRFSLLVELASGVLTTICQPLWNRLAVKMSGYNYFIQTNSPEFDETGLIDPPDFQIAAGPGTSNPIDSIAAADNDDQVTINWTPNTGTGTALANDVGYAMCFNVTQGVFGIYNTNEVRSSGQITVTLETLAASGDTIYAYLAFKSADGLTISGTEFLSAVVP